MLAPSRQETIELLTEELLHLTCTAKSPTPSQNASAQALTAGQPTTPTVHKVETFATLAQIAGQPITQSMQKTELSPYQVQLAGQTVTHTVQKVAITDHVEQGPASALRIP
jgi:hypothetical protein